jgi:hypothetical protein
MILSYFKNKAHKPIYTYKILNILSEDINNTFSKSQAVKKQIQSKPGLVNDTTFWNSNIYNKEKKTFKDVLFINSNIFINEKLLDDFINTQLKNLGLNKGNLVGIDTYKTKLKSIQTYISDFKSKESNDKNIESSSKEIVCNKTFNELETDININLQSFKDSRAKHDMLTSGINTNNYCLYKLLLENKESITELKNAVECSDCFIKVKEKLDKLKSEIITIKELNKSLNVDKDKLTQDINNITEQLEQKENTLKEQKLLSKSFNSAKFLREIFALSRNSCEALHK